MIDTARREATRGPWLPEFETTTETLTDQEWPVVVVTKWEINLRGERRYVDTQVYRPRVEIDGPEQGEKS